MEGKIVLVTGGSSGIGKAAALEFARQGAEVIILCRKQERGQQALAELKKESRNQQVHLIQADLSLLEDVRRSAEEIKRQFPRLDVLINNAGMVPRGQELTAEGLEVSWVTNYLSAFMLTNLLTDQLLAAEQGRIINVTSEAHRLGEIDFSDLATRRKYTSYTAYCDAKLALLHFTYEMARRIEFTSLTCNCVHPGRVASNFGRSCDPFLRWTMALYRPFLPKPANAARTLLYLASGPELAHVNGQYFKKTKAVPSSASSYNLHISRRLWDVSVKQTGLVEVS